METGPVRKRTSSLSTFSEIDTSDLPGDLSELPNFDHLKDMMTEEFSIPRTDFVNSTNSGTSKTTSFLKSFQKFLKIPKVQNNNVLPMQSSFRSDTVSDNGNNVASPIPQRDLRSIFPCVVCGLEFQHKSRMKDHVRSRHLRLVVSCHECDRRVFSDRMARHWKHSCPRPKFMNDLQNTNK